MRFQRRQLLRILSFAFGSSFILSRNQLGMAAQTPRGAADSMDSPGGTEMEKVTGIGGLFFRAHDPKALGRWYQQHLGVSLTPSSYEESVWQQEAAPPFRDLADEFRIQRPCGDPRVQSQERRKRWGPPCSRAAGIAVKIDPQSYPNGRFARLHDPEGNPIELWQPARPDAPR